MLGARVHYIEGFSPTDDPDSILVEGMSDAFAEYYSRQLSANIRRGVAYIGEYSYAGHVIPGGMPQIVDDETFEKVQKRRSR